VLLEDAEEAVDGNVPLVPAKGSISASFFTGRFLAFA